MIVSLLGLIISFFAYVIAFPYPHQRRFDIYIALLTLHLVATIAYWLFSFESAVDAYTYYRDPYNFYQNNPLESGTYFLVFLDQTIKRTLGGSFLDHFFLFQSFGMLGIALLMRSFNEVAESLGVTVPLMVYAVLFLPGMHFWSVAIGKDGLVIMAISLSLWAAMKIERRYMWMLVAVVIMGLIRPHIAAFAVFALACSVFFTHRVGMLAKMVLVPITMAGLAYAVFRAQELLGTGDDIESISTFIEGQQELGQNFGSGANIFALSYPGKVFTLLFRPLFIDSDGAMGLAASMENVLLLGIFGYVVLNWKTIASLFRRVGYVAYAVVFSSIVIAMLSLVNYNIGLGQRQKMMAIPGVLLIFATICLYKRFLASLPSASAGVVMVEAEPEPEATYETPANA